LLEHLETVPLRREHGTEALRFPVQSVIRPDRNFRGFAGRVAGGVIRPGDAVLALPSGQLTRVEKIVSFGGDLEEAIPQQSVVLKLEDEIDLSRGEMLVSPGAPPSVSREFAAMVVWLNEKPLQLDHSYVAKHAGRQVKAKATRIRFRIDVNRLTEHAADELEMNGIAFVEFKSSSPLYFDPYTENRTTGSFILIDAISNATVGAAMIREDLVQSGSGDLREAQAFAEEPAGAVTAEERWQRRGHRSAIFSVTGSDELGERLERALFEGGFEVALMKSSETPSAILPALLRSHWRTGTVIVYVSQAGSREQQSVLEEVAGEHLFEIAATEKDGEVERALNRAIAIAQTLRTADGKEGKGKANGNARTQ
jgi:hypothetical protein